MFINYAEINYVAVNENFHLLKITEKIIELITIKVNYLCLQQCLH